MVLVHDSLSECILQIYEVSLKWPVLFPIISILKFAKYGYFWLISSYWKSAIVIETLSYDVTAIMRIMSHHK